MCTNSLQEYLVTENTIQVCIQEIKDQKQNLCNNSIRETQR